MDVSLSDFIETGQDGNALSLMDVLSVDDDLFDSLSAREVHGRLRVLLESCLTERERYVLTLRYGLNGSAPLPQREIAKLCGISRSYVSRIEKKALQKLADALRQEDAI